MALVALARSPLEPSRIVVFRSDSGEIQFWRSAVCFSSAEVSPSGSQVAYVSQRLADATGVLEVWDLGEGRRSHRCDLPTPADTGTGGGAISWSPDEAIVAVAAEVMHFETSTPRPAHGDYPLVIVELGADRHAVIETSHEGPRPVRDLGWREREPRLCFVCDGQLFAQPVSLHADSQPQANPTDLGDAVAVCLPPSAEQGAVLRQEAQRWVVTVYDADTWEPQVKTRLPPELDLGDQPRLLDLWGHSALVCGHEAYVVSLGGQAEPVLLGSLRSGRFAGSSTRVVAVGPDTVVALEVGPAGVEEQPLLTLADVETAAD
jgi:hypothetical protein